MKRFWIQFGVTIFILLSGIAVYVSVIDPFYHYHVPIAGTSPYLYTQIYQSPGIAKHFEYDSAIVGTSMTENFRKSWFEEVGYDTVKICYAGGRTKDIQTVMEEVFKKKPDLKFVITDIEAYQITMDPESRYQDIPQYLYNDTVVDDEAYWWNSDVFWAANARLLESIKGIIHDLDDAYTWTDPELFSKEKVLGAYREEFGGLRTLYKSGYKQDVDMNEKLRIARMNVENYLDLIKSHPDTEFVFFFPPYSAVYWHRNVLSDGLWILDVDRYVAELLIPYENVHVYYFQDEFEWIENIDNYRDECHHVPNYNRYIFDAIQNGEKEITSENINSYFDGMREWIDSYDFESMWE